MSSQLLMSPEKMRPSVSPSNFSPAGAPLTWYAMTAAPSAIGMCTRAPPLAPCCSVGVIGTSLAPKSTVLAWIWAIPPPEPIAW